MTSCRIVGCVLVVLLIAVLTLANPAAAHVEVTAKPAKASAADVTVSFNAESESSSAGMKLVQVALPSGITTTDVSLLDGPRGWKLTPWNPKSGDTEGYQVEGPALKVGTDLEYSGTIEQLPNVRTLPFKTIQIYTDGQTDRWIQLTKDGEPEPRNPAPTVKLAAAEPAPNPTGSTPAAAPIVTTAAAAAAPTATAVADNAPGKTSPWVWVALTVVIVALGALIAWIELRRRTNSTLRRS
jgi:uncharacterized protein YcnI